MDEFDPDLGLLWHEQGRGESTVIFSKVVFGQLGRVDVDLYTGITTLAMEQRYAVSFDFDAAGFKKLLGLLPQPIASKLAERLTGPFDEPDLIDLPPGAVAVGIRARLGTPQQNGDERYVPLLVQAFSPPAALTSIEWD